MTKSYAEQNRDWFNSLNPVQQTAMVCILLAQREIIRNGDTEHNRAIMMVIRIIAKHFDIDPNDTYRIPY
jgi:hypothetical protein